MRGSKVRNCALFSTSPLLYSFFLHIDKLNPAEYFIDKSMWMQVLLELRAARRVQEVSMKNLKLAR